MGCLCRFKHQRHASKVPDAAIRGSDAVLPGIGWALNEEYIYNRAAKSITRACQTIACRSARTCRC
jgi:hypothetical protein